MNAYVDFVPQVSTIVSKQFSTARIDAMAFGSSQSGSSNSRSVSILRRTATRSPCAPVSLASRAYTLVINGLSKDSETVFVAKSTPERRSEDRQSIVGVIVGVTRCFCDVLQLGVEEVPDVFFR